jgi:hypothetical protein
VTRRHLNIIIADAFQPNMFAAYGIPDWKFEWRERLGDDSLAAGESGEFIERGHADFAARTIRMSESAARESTEWTVYQTMLHEIAHALSGFKSGHGPKWQQIAQQIGCEMLFVRTHGDHNYLALPGYSGRGVLINS